MCELVELLTGAFDNEKVDQGKLATALGNAGCTNRGLLLCQVDARRGKDHARFQKPVATQQNVLPLCKKARHLPLPYQGIQTECFWERFNRKAVQHHHRRSQRRDFAAAFPQAGRGLHTDRVRKDLLARPAKILWYRSRTIPITVLKAHQCKRLQDHKTAKASATPGRPAEAINVEDAALGRCYRCGLQCGRNLFRHVL